MKNIILAILSIAFCFVCYGQRQKVIFDCDLGGDIDDAFALALLLTSQEKVDILGIVMDHGHTPGRAEVACKFLYETGMDHIPVFVGDHTPGIVGQDSSLEKASTQMIWSKGFKKLEPQKEHATDFIIRMLNKYPGEVILFTVGPVDNIGKALDREPEILKKAKNVVSMFGSIKTGYNGGEPSREWNVRANIEASKKLMNSGANLILAPTDITDHVILTNDYLLAVSMRNTPMTDALSSLYALWYKHLSWAVKAKMFDAVAVGMVLWPELFTTKQAFVYVDDNGYTKIDKNKESNCIIGITINKDEFLNRMVLKIQQQDFKRK
jgi:inosine-uridine nucleoside N-ribohydrolase